MSEMPVVVLDPGHGGPEGTQNRGSSWNRARGPNGLLEKDVAYDLAQRVAARLRGRAQVEITRSAEANPSLAERAELARRTNAAVFLSLHLNGSANAGDDATDVYVAPDSKHPSRALGESVLRHLAGVTGAQRSALSARDLGMLHASRHAPRTAAVLAEIAHLTNERQARALEGEEYRNRIADALTTAITEHLSAPVTEPLAVGDGSPFVRQALESCWVRCEELKRDAASRTSVNAAAAQRILTETGIRVDANPYVGITRAEIEAVIRAAFSSHAMPEVLLALWAKEGSTRSVTTAVPVPQATSDANARSLFRSQVFYEDLGLDHFVVTRYDAAARDNVWDRSDSAAGQHETRFTQRVRDLVTGRFLNEDIAGALNSELTVSRDASGSRSVVPATRFYALALLLADAFWSKLLANAFPLLPSISDGLNYLQWNIRDFPAFLASADRHRREGGRALSIDEWALHTTVRAGEYDGPRRNAIRFLHYLESYRPIFAHALNLIKPGLEDLRLQHTAGIEAEAMAVPSFTTTNAIAVGPDWVPMTVILDQFAGAGFGALHMTPDPIATVAAARTRIPGFRLIPDPASSTNFFLIDNADALLDGLHFRDSGANIEGALQSVLCYPANPANVSQLAPSPGRFPVAILVHGNLTPATSTGTLVPSGAPFTIPFTSITITPARGRAVATPPHSYRGFSGIDGGGEYLQEALAHIGFVSMSINTNGANQHNLNVAMRAEYIMKYLDQLARFAATPGHFLHNKLDFSRVALIGHSRGGDAVVTAVHVNKSRPAPTTASGQIGRRYGIKSVISISPTDITGILLPAERRAVEIGHDAHHLIVYGSHDGDVIGGGDGSHSFSGCGFRMYDRSNTHRAFVFIHGANHNRFNRTWADEFDTTPAPLLRPGQETLARTYVTEWLRYSMMQDWARAARFNGDSAPPAVVMAGSPAPQVPQVSLMWKFGSDLLTVERYQDTVDTTNTLTGAVVKPGYVSEVEIDVENDPDLVTSFFMSIMGIPGSLRMPTFPHVDRVSKGSPRTAPFAPLREEIPAGTGGRNRNFTRFSHLTFRVTKKYPITDTATIAATPFPNFTVTLEDTSGRRKTVTNADILAANTLRTRPYLRFFWEIVRDNPRSRLPRNLTKCNLETWRVPLSLFRAPAAGAGPFAMDAVRAIEFDIDAAAGQPVYIDTISLVKI